MMWDGVWLNLHLLLLIGGFGIILKLSISYSIHANKSDANFQDFFFKLSMFECDNHNF